MKLDKKQGFGTISGSLNGALYEQNGKLFDAYGDEVTTPEPFVPIGDDAGDKPPAPKVAAKTKSASGGKKAAKAVKAAVPEVKAAAKSSPVDSQLAAQGL